jgi:hypothetical protein
VDVAGVVVESDLKVSFVDVEVVVSAEQEEVPQLGGAAEDPGEEVVCVGPFGTAVAAAAPGPPR